MKRLQVHICPAFTVLEFLHTPASICVFVHFFVMTLTTTRSYRNSLKDSADYYHGYVLCARQNDSSSHEQYTAVPATLHKRCQLWN